MEDKVSWFLEIKKAGEKWVLCSFFKRVLKFDRPLAGGFGGEGS